MKKIAFITKTPPPIRNIKPNFGTKRENVIIGRYKARLIKRVTFYARRSDGKYHKVSFCYKIKSVRLKEGSNGE